MLSVAISVLRCFNVDFRGIFLLECFAHSVPLSFSVTFESVAFMDNAVFV